MKDLKTFLLEFYENDLGKVNEWYSTKNILFGGLTPNQMIKANLENVILEMIVAAQNAAKLTSVLLNTKSN